MAETVGMAILTLPARSDREGPRDHLRRRTPGRGAVWAMLVFVAAIVLGTASPAGAHAVVVSSQPTDRDRLTSAPEEVTVTFSESVSPELGGLSVLDGKGERVDDGVTTQPGPETVRTKLKKDLADGTYVANYRVVSADGHPVNGAIVFSVGTIIDEASASGVTQQSSPGLEVLFGIGRFLAYLGGLLAAGVAFFACFIHDRAPDRERLPKVLYVAALVALFGQLVILVAQAALASGSGIGAIVDPSVLVKVLGGRLGYSSAMLVVGLATCAVAMKVRGLLVAQCLAFYGLVMVAVSYSLWGHTIESEAIWLSTGVDVTHGATAALWFGGLAALAVVLVQRSRAARHADTHSGPIGVTDKESARSVGESVAEQVEAEPGEAEPGEGDGPSIDLPTGSPADTVGIVIRFSTFAAVSIVLLGLAGGVLAWLELGSLEALVSTGYGRTLVAKLVIVVLIGGVAAYNHFRLLPVVLGENDPMAGAETTDPEPVDVSAELDALVEGESWDEPNFELPEWRRLLRTVTVEALGIVAVLAVTAVLVNLAPGRTASSEVDSGPYNATKPVGKGKVDLTVVPAKAGTNTMHITYLTNDSRAAEIAQSVSVEMSLTDKSIGPLSANATKAGLGHFVVLSTPAMSIPGTWKVTLVSRLGEFEQERTSFEVPIAEAPS